MRGKTFAWVTAAAVALLAMSIAAWFIPRPVESDEYAAWAQCAGSVIAIGVAAWAGLLPSIERAKDRELARQGMFDAVEASVEWFCQSIGPHMFAIAFSDYETARKSLRLTDRAGVEASLRSLLIIPRNQWPSHELFHRVNMLADHLPTLTERARTLPELSRMSAQQSAMAWDILNNGAVVIESHIRMIRKTIADAPKR